MSTYHAGQKTTRRYLLAIKYWLQGDKWRFAVEYAKRLVEGFER